MRRASTHASIQVLCYFEFMFMLRNTVHRYNIYGHTISRIDILIQIKEQNLCRLITDILDHKRRLSTLPNG